MNARLLATRGDNELRRPALDYAALDTAGPPPCNRTSLRDWTSLINPPDFQ